jgi:hypothetical protein
MIWRAARYILIAASLAGIAAFLYVLSSIGPPHGVERWLWLFPVLAAMNVAYLIVNAPQIARQITSREPSRIFRLFILWLDAKEAELKKRADQNSN